MSDYSWIQVGVKAVVVDSNNCPEMIGEVVTIASLPRLSTCGSYICVDIENPPRSRDGLVIYRFSPNVRNIKPYIDDDRNDTTTWESIASVIGVDIRRVAEATNC